MNFMHVSFIRTYRGKAANMREKIKNTKILIEYNIDRFNNGYILNIITIKTIFYNNF